MRVYPFTTAYVRSFDPPRQFGPSLPFCTDRRCAYAIIFDAVGRMLVVEVRGTFHLVGGGIDPGEDAVRAVIREAQEEVGCTITNLEFVGRANQVFPETKVGPLRKLGEIYRARFVSIDPSRVIEKDHEARWITPEAFLTSTASDFQKWAVERAMKEHVGDEVNPHTSPDDPSRN